MSVSPDHDIPTQRAPLPPLGPFEGKRRAGLWTGMAWGLVVTGVFIAGGLSFGPRRYFAGRTYEALREFGGIRLLGAVLFCIVFALVWTMARADVKHIGFVLVAGVVYNLYWLLCVLLAWIHLGVTAWTAVAQPALSAFIYFLLVTRIDERRAR